MPYSVLIWLNSGQDNLASAAADLGESGDDLRGSAGSAGSAAGALNTPPHDRLVYGFYKQRDEADAALELLASTLREQAPIRVMRRPDRQFIIPAGSVRYVACEEVERPRDHVDS